jgi:6-phosphogluconolactonase
LVWHYGVKLELIRDVSNENLVGLCATNCMSAIADAWSESKSAHIVITGGRTGLAIVKALDEALFRLIRENNSFEGCMLHVWFSDERFVTYEDPDRNDTALISGFGLCTANIVFHRAWQAGDLDEAATEYALEVDLELGMRPFDAVVLSMGEDGHIASLFPGLFDPEFATAALAVHNSPKLPSLRVSLSLARLANAKHIFIFALGAGKAAALQSIATGPVGLLERSSPNGELQILTDLSAPTSI